MNSMPSRRAACLSLLFSMIRLVFPYRGDMSSDVASRMMAVTASQRLKSQKVKGNSILSFSPFSEKR